MKVGLCGHFGFDSELLNGQTIKTKNVTLELEKQLGNKEIRKIDTSGGLKTILSICVQTIGLFKDCRNIIIFPAENGLKVFVPLCLMINLLFKRKLHYVVIGGWLDKYLLKHGVIRMLLKYFDGIYVETAGMRRQLNNMGLNNIEVMPNFKDIYMLGDNELDCSMEEPLSLCTFSRVMKEKGIEDAIDAVVKVNSMFGKIIFKLDIYGQIDNAYKKSFEEIILSAPSYVKYCGTVSASKSVETIRKYYALLFPTYYEGEGFAGTLLDAMAAGVPVIASDWKYNHEIVLEGKTGILFKLGVSDELENKLIWILENREQWEGFKLECLESYKKYLPSNAISVLMCKLD